MLVMQWSISLLSFFSKILLLAKKNKIAWVLGIISTVICIYYFFVLNLNVYSIYEIGMVLLMLYGVFTPKKNRKIENSLYIIIIATIAGLSYFAYSGVLTTYELISSIAFLLGTHCLTHKRENWGWFLYIIGHILMGYLTLGKGQHVVATFQFISVPVSILGIFLPKKDN